MILAIDEAQERRLNRDGRYIMHAVRFVFRGNAGCFLVGFMIAVFTGLPAANAQETLGLSCFDETEIDESLVMDADSHVLALTSKAPDIGTAESQSVSFPLKAGTTTSSQGINKLSPRLHDGGEKLIEVAIAVPSEAFCGLYSGGSSDPW